MKQNKELSYVSFLKMFISRLFQDLLTFLKKYTSQLRQQGHPQYYQNTYYKRMKVKINQNLKFKKDWKAKELKKQAQMSQQLLSGLKAKEKSTKWLVSQKRIYFQEDELRLVSNKLPQISYQKQSNGQYNTLIQSTAKKIQNDPQFEPQLKLKKVLNAKQYRLTQKQDRCYFQGQQQQKILLISEKIFVVA